MKRILFLLLLCLGGLSVQAQNDFGKVTAETADFIRFNNNTVSLYTGQISVSVPLYHLKDKDFDIPFVLNYAGEGFQPAVHHGTTGLHWSMAGGGVVTREVYGVPDDFEYYMPSAGRDVSMGFWQAVQKRTYSPTDLYYFSDNLSMLCTDATCTLPPIDGKYYDCEPDMFTFSMPGHHATFMIDNQGKIQVSQKGYQVDLSGMTAQTTVSLQPQASTIVITTPDGYQYHFGGSIESLEFSTHRTTGSVIDVSIARSCINAWHLTQIVAPNGRTLSYSYMAHDNLSVISPFWSVNSATIGDGSSVYSCNVNKRVFLSSATVADTGVTIGFSYSLETCEPFYSEFTDYNALSYKLDNVTVKQGTQTLYTWELSYENYQHLRFLSKVTQPDGGSYAFSYIHRSDYPGPTTEEADIYGFWPKVKETTSSSGSGSGGSETIIDPEPDGPEMGDTINTGTVPILPLPTVSDNPAYSLMQRITYPTGGYTEFTYEQHRYGKRTSIEVGSENIASFVQYKSGKVSGHRIKKIVDHHTVPGTDIDRTESRSYTYLLDDGTTSSGFLIRTQPYKIYAGDTIPMTTTVWEKNYNIEEPHIGYSYVTETYGDNSYIRYRYSDYSSCPDGNQVNYHWEDKNNIDGMDFVTSNVALKSSNYRRRGLLLQRSYYTSGGTERHRVNYSYHNMGVLSLMPPLAQGEPTANQEDYIVSFRPVGGGAGTMAIKLTPNPVMTEQEIEYPASGSSYNRSVSYTYNDLGLMKTRTTTGSDGQALKTSYFYPSDLAASNNVYAGLVSKNAVNLIVEERDTLGTVPVAIRRQVPKILSNGGVVPETVQESRGSTTCTTVESYPVYDSYGNPVHVVRRDGTEQVLFWGYKGRYLIGVVEGSTYSAVVNALGGTLPASFSTLATPSLTAIDGLRNSLEGASVTTYTYSPLVGLTKETLPNGNVRTYHYNAAGELIAVRDANGDDVETYSKHYQEN